MGAARSTTPAPLTFEHGGLVLVVNEGEPTIGDEALATHLNVPLRQLRELAKRHRAAGNISGSEVYRTVRFTSSDPGKGGRPGHGFLYTEADALFLVTRCETPKAVAATKTMIAAFIAARRQLAATPESPALPPPPPPAKALPSPPPAVPSGLMTRSGIHDERWSRMRTRKVTLMALAAGIDHLIHAEDWAALSICLDTMAEFARPTLATDAPATGAGDPPLLAVRELKESLGRLLLTEDWRGILMTGEMIAHLAAPHAGPRRRSV